MRRGALSRRRHPRLCRSVRAGVEDRTPAGSGLLLVNNYARTGIGDFGRELEAALRPGWGSFPYLETSPDGRGVFGQSIQIVRHRGTVLANLGLTAWGSSSARNVLGFLALAIRGLLGRPTVVLLHGLIETIDPATSGFSVGRLRRSGAHFVVARLRRARLVVFSSQIAEQLAKQYGISPALLTPIPCREPRGDHPPVDGHPIILTAGYLSPYKGLTLLPEVRAALNTPSRFIVAGGPHRLLAGGSEYERFRSRLEIDLPRAGIEMVGFLAEDELDALIRRATLGLLPYAATQGASATFSRLASGELPVVAPRLPEFLWLASLGAGVRLSSLRPAELADAVAALLTDPAELQRLAVAQGSFARRFSWGNFVHELNPLLKAA